MLSSSVLKYNHMFLLLLPNSERIPHSTHTSRERPTLPLFIRTPLGAMKMPLPTTVPRMMDTAGRRPICLRRCTTSSSVSSFFPSPSVFLCVLSISAWLQTDNLKESPLLLWTLIWVLFRSSSYLCFPPLSLSLSTLPSVATAPLCPANPLDTS